MSMTMATCPYLTFQMGFKVGNTTLPDPSSFSGKESDLDTMGERDATGLLHRNRVATKHPMNLSYKNLPWGVITEICQLLMADSFSFTYPSPFSTSGSVTITAYAGDRDFTAVWSPENDEWLGDIKVSIIEY